MKIIQYDADGVVVSILNARSDATMNNIALADDIPVFAPKDGYNGVLKYGDNGLYWDYEEVPVSDEISAKEALDIITGG